MDPAIEKLRMLGFDADEQVLREVGRRSADLVSEIAGRPDIPDELKQMLQKKFGGEKQTVTDILLHLGMGDYDYDTGEWTPRSGRVYAFDAEVFDVGHMYTLFLQGVQSIVPDIRITDIREDLSGMTDGASGSGDGMHPPADGKRSVSFACNGHEYSVELDSYGDWFNEEMFSFMDRVLEKENCPLKLYEFSAHAQFVIVVYTGEAVARQLQELIEPY